MADRNREDVRVRLSAEGQEEIVAAFRKIQAEADKTSNSATRAGQQTGKSFNEANTAADLLARQFGIQLPRSLSRYISSLAGVQTALKAAFNATIVLAVAAAALEAGKKLGDIILQLRGINDEATKAEEAVAKMQATLFAPKGFKEATNRVAALNAELRQVTKQNEEVARTFLGWTLPRVFQSDVFKRNDDQTKSLAASLQDAENERVKLGVQAQKAAKDEKLKLQDEIELLGASAEQRIRILAIQEQRQIQIKLEAGDLSKAQAAEFAGLVKTKEQLSLKAEAAKQAKEQAEKAFSAFEALQTSRATFLKSQAANELAIQKASAQSLSAEEKRRFDAGLTQVEDFANARRRLLEEEGQKEIAILEQQAADLTKQLERQRTRPLGPGELPDQRAKDVLDTEKELATVTAQTEVKRIENATQRADLEQELFNTAKAATLEQLRAESQLLAAQGQRTQAARIDLEAQVAGLERLKGESDAAFAARQQVLLQTGQAKIDFEEIQARAQQAMAELDLARKQIELDVLKGITSQAQGQRDLAALEKARLPVLQQISAEFTSAAETVGDASAIQKATEFDQSIQGIGTTADKIGTQIRQNLGSSLTEFFTTGIQHAESFGDAMRALALSVVQMVQQIAVQLLTLRLLGQPGKGGAGGTGLIGLLGFSGGGLALGPGTSTSDSIPARLSNFEFVVRSAVVKQPGMLEFLNDLNTGGRLHVRRSGGRGYADGGLVMDGAPGAPGTAGRADLNIGLNPELALKSLSASPEWARVLVRTLDQNRKQANNALGRGVR